MIKTKFVNENNEVLTFVTGRKDFDSTYWIYVDKYDANGNLLGWSEGILSEPQVKYHRRLRAEVKTKKYKLLKE